MKKLAKFATTFLCVLLASMLSAAVLNQSILTYAQIPPGEEVIPPSELQPPTDPNSAVVILAATVGGTTDPAPGPHEYPNGTVVEMTAIPQDGFEFKYWIIEGGYTATDNLPPIYFTEDDDPRLAPPRPPAEVVAGDRLILSQNPLVVLCGYAWSFQYQAVFAPETPFTRSADAIVTVLGSVGGNSNPSPGTYSYANDTTYTLTATPNNGFEFQYWVVTGSYLPGHGVTDQPQLDATVITSNPLDVSCGYGYEYTYQPLFAPTGTSTGIPTETFYIVVIILAIIAVIAVAVAVYMSMKQSNK